MQQQEPAKRRGAAHPLYRALFIVLAVIAPTAFPLLLLAKNKITPAGEAVRLCHQPPPPFSRPTAPGLFKGDVSLSSPYREPPRQTEGSARLPPGSINTKKNGPDPSLQNTGICDFHNHCGVFVGLRNSGTGQNKSLPGRRPRPLEALRRPSPEPRRQHSADIITGDHSKTYIFPYFY